MEIEKLIERLQNWDGIKPDREIDCAIEGLKALQAENDRLKKEVQQMRWIPVEERLPEEQGEYIVFVDGKVTTDFYCVCEDIKRWLSYDGGFNSRYFDPYSSKPKREPPYPRVTHWMPLPKAPKEVTHEK